MDVRPVRRGYYHLAIGRMSKQLFVLALSKKMEARARESYLCVGREETIRGDIKMMVSP